MFVVTVVVVVIVVVVVVDVVDDDPRRITQILLVEATFSNIAEKIFEKFRLT